MFPYALFKGGIILVREMLIFTCGLYIIFIYPNLK
jgi:hypothetical protein